MIKRMICFFIVIAFLVSIPPTAVFAANIVASGYCGGDDATELDEASGCYKNLSWTLGGDGLLTISGIGEMMDYGSVFGTKPLEPWYSQRRDIKTIKICNGVTSIGSEAFHECFNLTSVAIPGSVTEIGQNAFYFCGKLQNITVPNSVTSIGRNAFSMCNSLISITLPFLGGSETSDRGWLCYVFGGASMPDGYKDGYKYVPSSLKTVIISEGCKNIGDEAFYLCTNLQEIVLPSSVTSIGKEAFYGCRSLTSVTISNGVTSIGKEAFRGCSSLTSMTIPDSVTSIGNSAFLGCSGLASVMFGNGLTSIGERAFQGCSTLTSLTLPDSLSSIADNAFQNSGLQLVSIPVSVIPSGTMGYITLYLENGQMLTIEKSVYADKAEKAVFSCSVYQNMATAKLFILEKDTMIPVATTVTISK